jgi:hypothetical protein
MECVGRKPPRHLLYLILSFGLGAAPGCIQGLEFGGESTGAIAPGLVPDPSYTPSVGDRAVLVGSGADAPGDMLPLLKDVTEFDKYERAIKSQATSELADMEQQGGLMRTPLGTRVSILSLKDRTHVGDRYAAEIRVLDGPFKDHTAWTPATLVARLKQADSQ